MIPWTSVFKLVVGRVSGLLRVVGVLAMPDEGLETKWSIESVHNVALGAGVLHKLVPSMLVGVFIVHHSVADSVEVRCWVISESPELFSEDDMVEFWHLIIVGTELPPWEESQLPAGIATCVLASGCKNSPSPTCLLNLTIIKSSITVYDCHHCKLRAFRRQCPINKLDTQMVAILSSPCLCLGSQGRLLFVRLWRDLTQQGGAVYNILDPKPLQYPGTRYHAKDSIIGWTAIRIHSALIFTVTATSESQFEPLEGCWYHLGVRILVFD